MAIDSDEGNGAMQIQLNAPKIWLASEAVDFRKAINGLSELVVKHFDGGLGDQIYIFYNRAKNKLKLLSYHRHGAMLIYKRLDKKKFTLKETALPWYDIMGPQLSWLLAGLDWIDMPTCNELRYEDYF